MVTESKKKKKLLGKTLPILSASILPTLCSPCCAGSSSVPLLSCSHVRKEKSWCWCRGKKSLSWEETSPGAYPLVDVGMEEKVLMFPLGIPGHRTSLGILWCCPVPPCLGAAGCTPALISKSSVGDAFESWPHMQCALSLLLAGAGS